MAKHEFESADITHAISPQMIQQAAGSNLAKEEVLKWFGWDKITKNDLLRDPIDEDDCRCALYYNANERTIAVFQPAGPPLLSVIDLNDGTYTELSWFSGVEPEPQEPLPLDREVYALLDILCRSHNSCCLTSSDTLNHAFMVRLYPPLC